MAQPQRPAQPHESPDAIYQRRCADFGRQRDAYSRRSSRNANLSLALIAGALACLGGWLWRGTPALLFAAGLLGAGFVISFIHHGRVDQTLRRYTELYAINDEGLLRLLRDWDALPLRQPPESRPTRKARSGFGQLFAPFIPTAAPAAPAAGPAEQYAAMCLPTPPISTCWATPRSSTCSTPPPRRSASSGCATGC